MRIDLRDIIQMPGESVGFDYEPDLSDCVDPPIKEIVGPAKAAGSIRNIAGVLELTAQLDLDAVFVCDRCLREETRHIHRDIKATLADNAQDSEDPEMFPLYGNFADIDEIVVTSFLLNAEESWLCREDCKGLCPQCGADLNEGPCSCTKEIDPRLAVLGQLLEE